MTATILSRIARQVAAGVLIGAVLFLLLDLPGVPGDSQYRPTLRTGALLLVHMTVMMGVCMLACLVPARRALRVEPAQALAADG